jgi:hypothetical protein
MIGEETIVKESGEEGFARTGRALTLTRAALTGDISACACSLRSSSESPLGMLYVHFFIIPQQEKFMHNKLHKN